MVVLARVPPGRSGRLWLRRRLATAQRGREQLDRTLRALAPVVDERRAELERRRAAWAAALAEARTWELRLTLLGGQDALHPEPWSAAALAVEVEVAWSTTLGVTYPSDARLRTAPSPTPPAGGSAARAPAVAAFRRAVAAGASVAAAQEAVRLLEAESARTRRRLRALEKRWLPWLSEQLRERELALEQAELEEAVRLRRRPRDGGPPAW